MRSKPGANPRSAGNTKNASHRIASARHERTPPEVVSPAWLVRAFLVVVVIALLCGYLTFCLLFSNGQWQLVLHPSRAGAPPQQVGGAPVQPVRFGADASGQPQLAGIWIPADPAGRYRHLTVLYLADGDGSLQGAGTRLADLRELGINVLAFDYRGYGASAPGHPSEARMEADAETAFNYLLSSRHVAADHIIAYGSGVGGFLAARLAAQHSAIPALVIDRPRYDIEQTVRKDARVRLLPVHLLFNQSFPIQPMLQSLRTPKLIISRAAVEASEVQTAADPKLTVALPPGSSNTEMLHALGRFLDQYAPPTPMPSLVPGKAP